MICFKRRRVDVLTKSSLRLPSNRTVVYIYRGSTDHEHNTERDRMSRNRNEENRMEWKELRVGKEYSGRGWKRGESEERKGMEHTRKYYRPTGGWAMRARMLVSYKQVQSGKWTGPTSHETLRSHEVLGVMPRDFGLEISYK